MVVIGYKWRFRRCAQRCRFSIVPIRDHDRGVGIEGPVNSLWLVQIRDPSPIEARNSAQDCLGRATGRLVTNQLKVSLPDCRENARGCAFSVEPRRDKHVGIDHNPVYANSVLRAIHDQLEGS